MFKIRVPLALLAGAVLASAPLALATEQPASTLQRCAAMLPTGKIYSFKISGIIDTTSGAPQIEGNMQVNDDTQVDRSQDGKSFGQCVAAFLR
jgi:hypothetical protein